jgi:hypothetical protein
MKPEILSLYRSALRSLRNLPPSHQGGFRDKMAYNLREIFDAYRGITDEARIAALIERGKMDVETLREIFSSDPVLVGDIFPIFASKSPNT